MGTREAQSWSGRHGLWQVRPPVIEVECLHFRGMLSVAGLGRARQSHVRTRMGFGMVRVLGLLGFSLFGLVLGFLSMPGWPLLVSNPRSRGSLREAAIPPDAKRCADSGVTVISVILHLTRGAGCGQDYKSHQF